MGKIRLAESQLTSIASKVSRQLIKEEKMIIESAVLSEDVVDKFKDLMRKVMVTAAVVSALLAAPTVSAQDKSDIKNIYQGSEIASTGKVNRSVEIQGVGKSMDQSTARRNLMTQNEKEYGNKEYNVSDLNISDTQFSRNSEGVYICRVKCSANLKLSYN